MSTVSVRRSASIQIAAACPRGYVPDRGKACPAVLRSLNLCRNPTSLTQIRMSDLHRLRITPRDDRSTAVEELPRGPCSNTSSRHRYCSSGAPDYCQPQAQAPRRAQRRRLRLWLRRLQCPRRHQLEFVVQIIGEDVGYARLIPNVELLTLKLLQILRRRCAALIAARDDDFDIQIIN